MSRCTVPPAGWVCTRDAGHEGPCAAVPSVDPGRIIALHCALTCLPGNPELAAAVLRQNFQDWLDLPLEVLFP